MIGDVADEVRLDLGRERAGLLYASSAMTQKVAGALSIGLTFSVLARVGYNAAEGASNTADAIRKLEFVHLGGPVVFVLLGALCMIGYSLDRRQPCLPRGTLERHSKAEIADQAGPSGRPSAL